MSSYTQQTRADRANSTSSTASSSSSSSSNPWLVLNGSSADTSPNAASAVAPNPFLQLAPVTMTSSVNQNLPKFRPTEIADDRQRLFLLRARDN
ncbi:hypothetical protein CJF31_00004222 [Rutstroemia sp. NJR-2017a BVV2]|nr:hypothetical protein CJF31_00002192 [Rutstroemia sp. NJR-2017a BVV2]PQE09356.1 hypothetical protein CJF31_00004222 [Rutstroemia sp. NJR-2017a BVV2]